MAPLTQDFAWGGHADEVQLYDWFVQALGAVEGAEVVALEEDAPVGGADGVSRALRVLIGAMITGGHNQHPDEGAFGTTTRVIVAWHWKIAVDDRAQGYREALIFQAHIRRIIMAYWATPVAEFTDSADVSPVLPGFVCRWTGADRPVLVEPDVLVGALQFEVVHSPSLS